MGWGNWPLVSIFQSIFYLVSIWNSCYQCSTSLLRIHFGHFLGPINFLDSILLRLWTMSSRSFRTKLQLKQVSETPQMAKVDLQVVFRASLLHNLHWALTLVFHISCFPANISHISSFPRNITHISSFLHSYHLSIPSSNSMSAPEITFMILDSLHVSFFRTSLICFFFWCTVQKPLSGANE